MMQATVEHQNLTFQNSFRSKFDVKNSQKFSDKKSWRAKFYFKNIQDKNLNFVLNLKSKTFDAKKS